MTTTLAAGTWQADPTHSAVEFVVRHLGLSKVRGRFTDFAAELVVGERPSDTRVTATINLASVATGDEQRDTHLRSADFFDLEESDPTMTFASTSITGEGDEFTMTGDLSLAGVTRPVELEVELEGVSGDPWGGTRAGFSAEGNISRKDFGIEFDIPLDGGGFVIGDKVKIELDLQFVAPQG
jgi:polyisoprenoid-binding protein YceI